MCCINLNFLSQYVFAFLTFYRYESKSGGKKDRGDEMSTETKSFRLILQEIGYQAGQHELLADTLTKLIPKELQTKSKELLRQIRNSNAKAKQEKDDLEDAYRLAEKSKERYRKSYQEWEEANGLFLKADKDGTISRNDIARMRIMSDLKLKQHKDCEAKYTDQLVISNRVQSEYYLRSLPGLTNSLQTVDQERIGLVKSTLRSCMAAETSIVPIKSKCQAEIMQAVELISVGQDQNVTIQRLKTGDLPPADLQFEGVTFDSGSGDVVIRREKKGGSLSRRFSRTSFTDQKREKHNLFQEKRKLIKKIDKHKLDITKGTKEMRALQLMIQTYTQTPEFGDPAKFQPEFDSVSQKVHRLEKELVQLVRNLDLVDSKMNLNSNSSLLSSPSRCSLGSLGQRRESYLGSIGSQSNCSETSEEKDSFEGSDNPVDEDSVPLRIGRDFTQNSDNKSDEIKDNSEVESSRLSNDWGEDFAEEEEIRVIALYEFDGEDDGSLTMQLGEEFLLVDTEPMDGWIKVMIAKHICTFLLYFV